MADEKGLAIGGSQEDTSLTTRETLPSRETHRGFIESTAELLKNGERLPTSGRLEPALLESAVF
jgi:hypothetical protein